MPVIGMRVSDQVAMRLRAFSASRAMSISRFCRCLMERGLDEMLLPWEIKKEPSSCVPKPVLERLLAAALCCEELCLRDLDGHQNRDSILTGIEDRVVAKVNKLMGE